MAFLKRISSRSLHHHSNSFCISRRTAYGIGLPAPPELRDIVKLELFEQESESKIEQLWLDQYRFDPRYISRTMSRAQYDLMMKRLEECPLFIYPIPYAATQKYYVLVSQAQHKHIFFTSIDSYNKDSENASAYLSLTFYDDLLFKQKNVCLVRGEVIQPIHLMIEQARTLIDDVLNSYQDDDLYTNNIQKFNKDSNGFDVNSYLETFDFVKAANELHQQEKSS